jgi:hypothetical protein
VNEKILEEVLKAIITLSIGGIVFWIGKIINLISDTRVKETEFKRDLGHLKRTLESQSIILARIDDKLDIADDRAAELDKRISVLEVYAKHNSSGFQRVIVGADNNA